MEDLIKLKKIHFINLFLICILIIFSSMTYSGYEHNGEFSVIETIQLLLLFSTLIIQLRYSNLFYKFSNKFIFSTRLLMFLALFYEEISFITKNLNAFKFNDQGELNFHNLSFLDQVLFNNINVPIINFNFNIIWEVFLYCLISILFGYGSYLPYLKRFSLLFLQKKYAFYSFLYPLLVFSRSLETNFSDRCIVNCVIHQEFFELFIYILLAIDTFDKISIMRHKLLLSK